MNQINDKKNTNTGILLLTIATAIFAFQDAITRILVQDYHPAQFIMFRQWVFLVFALAYCHYNGGIVTALKTRMPVTQVLRNGAWIFELIIFAFAVRQLQLAEMHAFFALFPLMVTMLAPFVLKESLGWRRILAVIIGFIGAIIIIRPGSGIYDFHALYALLAAFLFAVYTLLTKKVSQQDSFATNLLYLAIISCLVASFWGLPNWQTPDAPAWKLIAIVCITGVISHVLLMKALEFAPASTLQPFNYLTLVWAIIFGFFIFREWPDALTLLGAVIIVSSGLFVIWRKKQIDQP